MVLIIGHRGARNLWPENSLEGFERTRDLGVDAVEFDVHLARDGELVVIHDPSLERTTKGRGRSPTGPRPSLPRPRCVMPVARASQASRRCLTSMPARRSSCTSRSRPTCSAAPMRAWRSGLSTSSPAEARAAGHPHLLRARDPRDRAASRAAPARARLARPPLGRAIGRSCRGARPFRRHRGLPDRRRKRLAGR